MIKCLEAWGAKHDIHARFSGRTYTIEIKYIGQEQAEFEEILAAAGRGEERDPWRAPYDAFDYFLVRALDAADQVVSASGLRVAALALSHSAARLYRVFEQMGWLDWDNPRLMRGGQTEAMRRMLSEYEVKYGDVGSALRDRLGTIDQIWVAALDERCHWSWIKGPFLDQAVSR